MARRTPHGFAATTTGTERDGGEDVLAGGRPRRMPHPGHPRRAGRSPETALVAVPTRSASVTGHEPRPAVALGYRRGFLVRHLPQQWATHQSLIDMANRHGCDLTEIVYQAPDERWDAGFDRLLWLAARMDGLRAIVTPSWRHLGESEADAGEVAVWLHEQAQVPVLWGD